LQCIRWKRKSVTRQVHFATWLHTIQHHLQKSNCALKTDITIRVIYCTHWIDRVRLIHASTYKNVFWKWLIFNHLKTLRAVWWQYWKDFINDIQQCFQM
jgi:hypothetical protein